MNAPVPQNAGEVMFSCQDTGESVFYTVDAATLSLRVGRQGSSGSCCGAIKFCFAIIQGSKACGPCMLPHSS